MKTHHTTYEDACEAALAGIAYDKALRDAQVVVAATVAGAAAAYIKLDCYDALDEVKALLALRPAYVDGDGAASPAPRKDSDY